MYDCLCYLYLFPKIVNARYLKFCSVNLLFTVSLCLDDCFKTGSMCVCAWLVQAKSESIHLAVESTHHRPTHIYTRTCF